MLLLNPILKFKTSHFVSFHNHLILSIDPLKTKKDSRKKICFLNIKTWLRIRNFSTLVKKLKSFIGSTCEKLFLIFENDLNILLDKNSGTIG